MLLSTFISANQMSILVSSRQIRLYRGTIQPAPRKKKRTAEACLPGAEMTVEGAKRQQSTDRTRTHEPSDLGNLNVN